MTLVKILLDEEVSIEMEPQKQALALLWPAASVPASAALSSQPGPWGRRRPKCNATLVQGGLCAARPSRSPLAFCSSSSGAFFPRLGEHVGRVIRGIASTFD